MVSRGWLSLALITSLAQGTAAPTFGATPKPSPVVQFDCADSTCRPSPVVEGTAASAAAEDSPFWVGAGPLADSLCKAADINFSRDGKWLLFTVGVGARKAAQISEPWPSVGFVSSDCVFGAKSPLQCQAISITSLSAVSHHWLSLSGQNLFVLDAGGRRLSRWPVEKLSTAATIKSVRYETIQLASTRAIKFRYDVYSPRSPVVQVAGYTPNDDVYLEAKRLSSAVAQGLEKATGPIQLETISLDQRGVIAAAYHDRADGTLLLWNPGAPEPRQTGLRQPYWDYLDLTRAGDGASLESFPMRVATGERVQRSYWGKPARTIRSNWSGDSIGSFGEAVFNVDQLRTLSPDFAGGRKSLWSYAVDQPRKRAVAVVLPPFSGGELQLLRPGERRAVPCLSSSTDMGAANPPPKRTLLELGSGPSALPARLYQAAGAGPSGRLIVYMHGGPDVSLAYEQGLDQIPDLVGLGYDVLVPEYRGTRGNTLDLMKGLGSQGRQALQSDTSELEQWIKASNYEVTVLYGVSFGGLFSWLLAESEVFDRHVLVAPLLAWRGFGELGGRSGDPDADGRRSFLESNAESVFGAMIAPGTLSAIPFMDQGRLPCRYRVPFLAIFGDRDDKSSASDLGSCQASEFSTVIILKDRGHESVGRASWERVKLFLAP